MEFIKKGYGKFLRGLAKVVHGIFTVFIVIVEALVAAVIAIGRGFGALISMGGCLLLILFMGPLLVYLPFILPLVLIMVGVIILGKKLISILKYYQYAVSEYLYDRADYFISGKKSGFDTIGGYGNKYRRMQEEAQRARWREQRERERQQWEEQFRRWYEYQRRAQQNQYRGDYRQQGGYTGGQQYRDPRIDFKKKYEDACDLLGVPYDTDEYQVKLAFRKKAKEYHPDVNPEPDATEKFQKLNDAYAFLSPENIQRYKSFQ